VRGRRLAAANAALEQASITLLYATRIRNGVRRAVVSLEESRWPAPPKMRRSAEAGRTEAARRRPERRLAALLQAFCNHAMWCRPAHDSLTWDAPPCMGRTEAAGRLPKGRLAAPRSRCACAPRGARHCGAVDSLQHPRARHASSQEGLWGCGAAVRGAVAARMRLKRPPVSHASETETRYDASTRSRCDRTAFEVRAGAGGGSQCYDECLICLM